MSTPAPTPRPGMPPIEPGQQPVAATPELGVGDASGSSGAAFAAALLGEQAAQPPQSPAQLPPQPVPVPSQPPPQPVPAPVPVPAPAQPVVPVPPQPPAPPQPMNFTDRFAPSAPPDPLASAPALPDIPPDTSPQAPQGMSDQQNHAWAGMRAQVSQYRRLAEEYRSKYNGVVDAAKKYQEERAAFGEQLNQRDARIKELEDDIGRTDLSRSPEFREKYDAPLAVLRDKVAAVFTAHGVRAEEARQRAEQVLTAGQDELPQMIAELPTHAQGQVMVIAEDADRLWSARDAALADWRASAEGLAAVAQRGSAIITAQHVAQMADKAIATAKGLPPDKLAPAFQVTDPQFAASRDEQERLFKSWIQQAPEEQKYVAMFEGFMAPKTYEMLQQTWLENQRLKEMLYQRGRFGTPPVSPSYAPPAPPPAPPAKEPTTATAGFAPAGDPAASFAAQLVNRMVG